MAAKMAFPERTVIGFIGDSAMQMSGLNVMITVSKYCASGPTRASSSWCSTTAT
jgi:pyruvate dehydrogenase (quinone)